MNKSFLTKGVLAVFCAAVLTGISSGESNHDSGISWKFAVISDTQGSNGGGQGGQSASCINDSVVQAIAADVVREKPEFMLMSGDFVNGWFRNGGTPFSVQYGNWKKAMKPVFDAGIRIYPVRGNHDDGPERLALPPLPAKHEPSKEDLVLLKQEYLHIAAELKVPENGPDGEKKFTYSFESRNALFLALDQYAGTQHTVNQRWIDQQLQNSKKQHVFVFGHEPAIATNHPDNLSFFKKERDAFWDSIGKAGAKIYFCGHDHFYDRALAVGLSGHAVWQIICGTGGGGLREPSADLHDDSSVSRQFHNSKFHGYVLVTVTGKHVMVQWKALVAESPAEWKVLDTFAYTASSD